MAKNNPNPTNQNIAGHIHILKAKLQNIQEQDTLRDAYFQTFTNDMRVIKDNQTNFEKMQHKILETLQTIAQNQQQSAITKPPKPPDPYDYSTEHHLLLNPLESTTQNQYSKVLRVSIYYPCYAITEEVLHSIFAAYGAIEVLRIDPVDDAIIAIIQFHSQGNARAATNDLQGRCIYTGCCQLSIEFASESTYAAEHKDVQDIGTTLDDNVAAPVDVEFASIKLHLRGTSHSKPITDNISCIPECDNENFLRDVTSSSDDLEVVDSVKIKKNNFNETVVFAELPEREGNDDGNYHAEMHMSTFSELEEKQLYAHELFDKTPNYDEVPLTMDYIIGKPLYNASDGITSVYEAAKSDSDEIKQVMPKKACEEVTKIPHTYDIFECPDMCRSYLIIWSLMIRGNKFSYASRRPFHDLPAVNTSWGNFSDEGLIWVELFDPGITKEAALEDFLEVVSMEPAKADWLFKTLKQTVKLYYKSGKKKSLDTLDDGKNNDDCSKFMIPAISKDYNESIRNRFVTRDWSKAARRGKVSEELNDDGETVFAEFEEVKTGQKYDGHLAGDKRHSTMFLNDDAPTDEQGAYVEYDSDGDDQWCQKVEHAENLDIIVKASDMAVEAISQAGRVVAIGKPLPLSSLIEAGLEDYWRGEEHDDESKGLMLEEGITRLAIHRLTGSSDKEREYAVNLLLELCSDEICCTNIAAEKGGLLLLSSMADSHENPSLAHLAVEVLERMERIEGNIKELAEAGRLDSLLKELHEGPDEVKADRTSVFDRLLQMIRSAIKNQDSKENMAYWLSNTSTLLFLLQRSLIVTGTAPTARKATTPTSIFGRMAIGFRSSSNVTAAASLEVVRPVEAKYPALLFKSGMAELELWCSQQKEEYAGSSWDELKHRRQAVGFLVIHKKYRISYDEIINDLCPVLSVQQLDTIALVHEVGNLENVIQGVEGNDSQWDLAKRIDVLISVGSGVVYLHTVYDCPIVHCDLIPSNILLDENFEAHVSDFGTARMLGIRSDNASSLISSTFEGTIGYLAPGCYNFIDELSSLDPELYKNMMYVKHYDDDVQGHMAKSERVEVYNLEPGSDTRFTKLLSIHQQFCSEFLVH